MPKQPNIVLCICDQLRAFETGCYGNSVVRTPNVDRLAAEGIRFQTAVTNFPVCMAARSVLLSGQYNRTCTGGVSNVAFPSRPGDHNMPEYPFRGRPHLPATTLPELLRARGYCTSAIGKWHIHSWPDDVGFDEYLIPRVHHCHSGQGFTENGGPEFVPPGYSVDFEADRIEQFIQGHRGGSDPFFLYYSISPPHCPVADAPEEYLTMYRPDDVPLRPNFHAGPIDNLDYFLKVYRYDFRHYNLGLAYADALPPGYDLRHVIAEYYGLTTWMDHALGRMLRALDEAGLADDTIVLFTSDHGDMLGSHGRVQKGNTLEESIRIPLLVRMPSRLSPAAGGAVVDSHVASLIDIAPTLLSLIGCELAQHMAGRDLSPLLRGEPADGIAAEAVIETSGSVGVRTPRHMYTLPLHRPKDGSRPTLGEQPMHLFDCKQDPYQLNDLAGKAHDVELDRLVRAFDARTPWMAS